MKQKPATIKARALRAKLQALAARGVNGEATAAQFKLSRLEARYDFKAVAMSTKDIFSGAFRPASVAVPVRRFGPGETHVASSVKWAIEKATGINCLFQQDQLVAQATPATARKLQDIANTITGNFGALWHQFNASGGNAADHGVFIMGLYDGMMNDVKQPGQSLPSRAVVMAPKRAKKRAVSPAPGLNLHPYSVAVELGKQVRFSVPLADIAAELERTIKGELKQ